MDEHGEINVLLFSGLTAHNGSNEVVAGLAESWEYDENACTYTFHLRDGVKWHDGEPFTAEDVKFTIEAIMAPDNGSENAPNYEDVQEITVLDDQTVSFRLSEPNAAFLEYMTMAILPQHLREGEHMQESVFFRAPVCTGPYKLESWDAGQSIVLVRNEDYFLGAPNIERVIFKIVPDDNAQAMQLESGEIDLALLDPKNAQNFADKEGYTCYDMIIDALKRAGKADREAVTKALAETKGLATPVGIMTLNANHDAEIPVGILKYENGKRIYLGEIVPE